MKLGYARISTRDQHAHLQHDALQAAGCERIFTETASGSRTDRPVLAELLAQVRPGDVIVVWKLDRLGRSLTHLVQTVGRLVELGVGFKSLQDPVDTTSAQGRLVFNLFASLAEFERDLIRERTQAGLVAARARGRVGGRPRGLTHSAEITAHAAATLYREGKLSVAQICQKLAISRSTLYNYLRFKQVEIGAYQKKPPVLPNAPPAQ